MKSDVTEGVEDESNVEIEETKKIEETVPDRPVGTKAPTTGTPRILKIIVKHLVLIIVLIPILLIWDCPFNKFLGIPCPGCGMTRACLSVARGDLALASYYHPLWWAVIPVGLFMVHIRFVKLPAKAKDAIIIGVALVFIVVYVYRLFVSHSLIVQIHLKDNVYVKILSLLLKRPA